MSSLLPFIGVTVVGESSSGRSWLREIVVGVAVATISTGLLSILGSTDPDNGRDRCASADRIWQNPPVLSTKDDRVSGVPPVPGAGQPPFVPSLPGTNADASVAAVDTVLDRLSGTWSARFRSPAGREFQTVYRFGTDRSWYETLWELPTGRVVASGTGRASSPREPDRVRLDFTSVRGYELADVRFSSADRMTWRIAEHSDARQIGRVLEFVRVRTSRGEE